MTKEEFLGLFLGYIIRKSDAWLPEEDTEKRMLNIMQKRLEEHNKEIRQLLTTRNGRKSDE